MKIEAGTAYCHDYWAWVGCLFEPCGLYIEG